MSTVCSTILRLTPSTATTISVCGIWHTCSTAPRREFSVDWDKENNAIVTATGEPYAVVGNEMRAGQDHSSTAVPSTQKMTVNGKEIKLSPYNIGWSNFFKLRDLGGGAGLQCGVCAEGQHRADKLHGL
jgi:hypothetical protein